MAWNQAPIWLLVLMSAIVVLGQQQLPQPQQQQPLQAPPTPAVNCTPLSIKPSVVTQKLSFPVNASCIVAQFAVYLTVGEGKYVQFNNGQVNQNLSQCHVNNVTAPKLTVDFPCGQLHIEFGHSDQKTYVSQISGYYDNQINRTAFANSTQNFVTSQSGHYYKCNTEQSISTNQSGYVLHFSNLALEAYKATPGNDFFAIPEECALDSQPVSDLVRIGVGICLVALVAIVLVAYFIGRRRWSERSSYESV